ncbi:PAS domain-containing sensor histidine kinase [Melioribacter sp. Ez-97]|uniref:sensor histidine kinase n=1 Tax=Melioribacter sp. Ez-97 TaxID=3423434 RepID=UPI003ED8BA28
MDSTKTNRTIYDESVFPHDHIKRESLFKIITEFSIDWIYWLDPHNKLIYSSPSCRYITGYSKEEFFSDQSLLIKIIAPEDKSRFISHTRDVLRGKIFCSEEFRIITKSGQTRWIAHNCQAVYDDNNKYIGRYISNRDITDIKKAHEEVRTKDKQLTDIYNEVRVGCCRISPEGKLISINNSLRDILGYNTEEEIDKDNFEKNTFLNIEEHNNYKQKAAALSVLKNISTACISKEGNILHFQETITPVKDNEGNVVYFEINLHDVTKQREAELSLLETEAQKKNLEKLKTEFLATISHEIRTPINVILNLIQILKSDLATLDVHSELLESAAIIETETRRIQRTIELILEMSQLAANNFEVSPEKVDLYNAINEVYDKYVNAARRKNIKLTVINESDSPIVYADKYSCVQIFTQLIDNAIKYTSQGEAVVLITEKSGKVIVEVKDTGVGIKKEYIPYLFSTFSQEDNSYSRMFEGTGLGLAVVKKHCDLNNALIEVESEKNKGAVFRVIFDKA